MGDEQIDDETLHSYIFLMEFFIRSEAEIEKKKQIISPTITDTLQLTNQNPLD